MKPENQENTDKGEYIWTTDTGETMEWPIFQTKA